MIRAIIIDDEKKARKNLFNLLQEYCTNVEVVSDASNITDGVKAIKALHPDLLFLDVKMHKETGFDLLDKFPEINFEIIFVTAHDKYAIKAFKFCALDYIMKPINIEELQEAVNKVKSQSDGKYSKLNYQVLKDNLSQKGIGKKKIAIPTSEGVFFVPINEILRCEADGSYCHVFLTNGKSITVSKILKEFDELLSEYNFLRIHQSHLVNLEYVKKYLSAKGGSLEMNDGSIIGISRNYKENLMSRLSDL